MAERQFTLEEVEEALKRAKYLLEKDEVTQFATIYEGNTTQVAYRDLSKITIELLQHSELLQVPLESLSPLIRVAKGE